MSFPNYQAVSQDIFLQTQCEHNFVCLKDSSLCNTELTEYRDFMFLNCLSKQQCNKRSRYHHYQICHCPVKRAAYGLVN